MFVVYDKKESNFDTFGLAVLNEIQNPQIEKSINGKFDLTFDYVIRPGDVKAQYVKEENIIKADGQLFRIRKVVPKRSGLSTWVEVHAPHVVFDLIDFVTMDNRAVNAKVQTALEILLKDTPFKVGLCDDVGINNAYFIEENKLESLNNKIIPRWDVEMEVDNYTITAKKTIGKQRNFRMQTGKNLLGIQATKSMSRVITRLYAKGYEGMTFEDINDGKSYVESPNIGKYSHVKEDIKKFDGVQDKHELLRLAKEELEKFDTPYYNIIVDLVELGNTENYKYFKELEEFDLGDTCVVYDSELNIYSTARVYEYTYNPVTKKNSKVVLGNFDNRLEETLTNFTKARNKLEDILVNGNIDTSYLEGTIDLLTNQLIASGPYSNAQVIDNKGILLENTDVTSPDFGALYLGPGIFSVANSKKEDNSWNWRTFGTGKGFVADEIVTGILDAALIRTGTISSRSGNIYMDIDNDKFKMGGKSGDIVEHDNTKSKYIHQDGSYTQISNEGLERFVASNRFSYNYLVYVGEAEVKITGDIFGDDVIVQLPDEFKGKNFKIFTSTKRFDLPWNYMLRGVYTWGLPRDQEKGTAVIHAAMDSTQMEPVFGRILKPTTSGEIAGWWIESEMTIQSGKGTVEVQYIVIA